MKRRILHIIFYVFFVFAMVSCDFFGPRTTTTVETTRTVTEQTTTTTQDEVPTTTQSALTLQLMHIYQLAVEADLFDGSYEEWLETVRGPQGFPGEDGREVNMRVDGDFIQWQYIGETAWTDLLDLSLLSGADGIGIESIVVSDTGELIVHYTDDSSVNLGHIIHLYTVQFRDYNGYLLDVQMVPYEGSATPPNSPSREGYVFSGWDLNTNIVTSDMVVTALYDVETFTVNYFDDDGDLLLTVEDVSYGTSLTLYVPEKIGHYFVGWFMGTDINATQFTEGMMVTSDLSLFARFELAGYTVTFKDDDGTILSKQQIAYGYSAIAPETPTKTGYTFTGWDTDFSLILGDLIVTATYTINHYTVYFDSAGGDDIAPYFDVAYQSTLTLPTPVRVDYDFLGWYWQDTEFTNTSAVTSDMELVAHWVLHPYMITLDKNIEEVFFTMDYGTDFGIAVDSAQRVFTFGNNGHGQLGVSGIALSVELQEITEVFSLADDEFIIQVEASNGFTALLTNKGALYMWGNNTEKQLCIREGDALYTPTRVDGYVALNDGETIISVSLGYEHTLMLTSLGRVFSCGNNVAGQLGDGTTTSTYIPTDITANFGLSVDEIIIDIEAGAYHSMAYTNLNRIFAWGHDQYYQVGDVDNAYSKPLPVDISGHFLLAPEEHFIDIEADYYHSMALTSAGQIYTWGLNGANGSTGVLGCGNNANHTTPLAILEHFVLQVDERIVGMHASKTHSLVWTNQGRVFGFGDNASKQILDTDVVSFLAPIEISSLVLNPNDTVWFATAAHGSTAVMTFGGELYLWGQNSFGQLASGDNLNLVVPNQCHTPEIEPQIIYATKGSVVDVLPPIAMNHLFDGWWSDGEEVMMPFTYDISSDLILTAHWQVIKHDFSFELRPDGFYVTSYTGEDNLLALPDQLYGIPIVGITASAFAGDTHLRTVILGQHVKHIGDNAFSNMPMLMMVSLNNATTDIGEAIFSGSPNIGYLTLSCEASLNLYEYFGTTNADIPDTLMHIELAEGSTFLDKTLFNNDLNDATLWLPKDWTEVPDNCFKDTIYVSDVIVPEGVTRIGKSAFEGSWLYSIDLPATLTDIDDAAFKSTDMLTEVFIPANGQLTRIGVEAFQYTDELAYITLPEGLERIEASAFFASELDNIIIPSSVTHMGPNVFLYTWANLYVRADVLPLDWSDNWAGTGLVIWGYTETVTDDVFFYALTSHQTAAVIGLNAALGDDLVIPDYYEDYQVTQLTMRALMETVGFKRIFIPSAITEIPIYCFRGSALETIVFPADSALTKISERAFESSNIRYLTLPDNLQLIDIAAFADCTQLEVVHLSPVSQLTHISSWAFSYCIQLAYFYLPDNVLTIDELAFENWNITLLAEAPSKPGSWHDNWNNEGTNVYWGVIELVTIDDVDYVLRADSHLSVVGLHLPSDTEIIKLQSSYLGFIVDEVIHHAFYRNQSIEYVYIPQSIVNIGTMAFYETLMTIVCERTEAPSTWDPFFAWNNLIVFDSWINVIYFDSLDGSFVEPMIILGHETLTSLPEPVSAGMVFNGWLIDAVPMTLPYTHEIDRDIYLTAEWVMAYEVIQNGVIYDVDPLIGTTVIGYTDALPAEAVIEAAIDGYNTIAIADGAFVAASMTTVFIPTGVLRIGQDAFSQCLQLEQVKFAADAQLTEIGFKAFYYNDALQEILLPETLQSIDDYAFSNCVSLTWINLPINILWIGDNAFEACASINFYASQTQEYADSHWSSIWNIDAYNSEWSVQMMALDENFVYAFYGDYTAKLIDIAYENLDTEPVIPSSLGMYDLYCIAEKAFMGNTTLISMTIPISITTIGTFAFAGSVATIYTDYTSYPSSWGDENLWNPDDLPIVFYVETHTLYFDAAGGTSVDELVFAYDEVITTLPTSTKTDYIFDGWYLDGVLFTLPATMSYHNDVTLIAQWSSPYEYTENGMTFMVYADHAILTSYAPETGTTVTVPASVEDVAVTVIGASAFINGTVVTVNLPNTIETISQYAFAECISLTTVNIAPVSQLMAIGDYAFDGCDNLMYIGLAPNLVSIGQYAFNTCYTLIEFHIAETVTTIGERAFRLCDALTIYTSLVEPPIGWHAEWNSSARPVIWGYVTTIDDGTLLYARLINDTVIVLGLSDSAAPTDLVIPDVYDVYPVVGISGGAFYQDAVIENLSIGSNVVFIAHEAFREASALTTVTIGTASVLDVIGSFAFFDCDALTTFNIPSDNIITVIGESAFSGSSNLSTIDRMSHLIAIEAGAFYGCYGLTTFYVPATVTTMGGEAFSHSVFGSSSLVIQTPLLAQPASWDEFWKADDVTVTWNYQG